MRHDKEFSASLAMLTSQQREDLAGGFRIEVSRGFVREHDRGTVREGPGDRHALRLPAGELLGLA